MMNKSFVTTLATGALGAMLALPAVAGGIGGGLSGAVGAGVSGGAAAGGPGARGSIGTNISAQGAINAGAVNANTMHDLSGQPLGQPRSGAGSNTTTTTGANTNANANALLKVNAKARARATANAAFKRASAPWLNKYRTSKTNEGQAAQHRRTSQRTRTSRRTRTAPNQ